MGLKELVATRNYHVGELERYGQMMGFMQRTMDEMNQTLGRGIDLPAATQEFKSIVDMDEGSNNGEEEDESKKAQMEGFMLVYELFRPLAQSYLQDIKREERDQSKLGLM